MIIKTLLKENIFLIYRSSKNQINPRVSFSIKFTVQSNLSRKKKNTFKIRSQKQIQLKKITVGIACRAMIGFTLCFKSY